LTHIDGYHATATITTVHQNVFPSGGGRVIGGNADGGTIPGPRSPYGDKMLYMLAPGEEVISNRHGQADRFRADRAAGRIPGYAGGGTTGQHYTSALGGGGGGGNGGQNAIQIWTSGVYTAAKALKALQAELEKAKKSLDKETQSRDDLQSQFDSIKSTVGSAYSTRDPFAALQATTTGGSVWAAGSGGRPWGTRSRRSMLRSPATPPILRQRRRPSRSRRATASTGRCTPHWPRRGTSRCCRRSPTCRRRRSTSVNMRSRPSRTHRPRWVGWLRTRRSAAQLRDANKELAGIRKEVRELRHDVKQADQNNQKAQDKNAKDVKDGVNGAASNGHRRGRG
jgi:hypothetical protein